MIPRCLERVRNVAKHALSVVANAADFAVHGGGSPYDPGAIRLRNGLMTEANAENGNPAAAASDEVKANAGFVRVTGTRREDDRLGIHGPNIVKVHFVVPPHDCVRA